MIILVNSDVLYRYFKEIPDLAFQLWKLATRPTTLVLITQNIAPELIAPMFCGGSLVRDSFCYRLIERLKTYSLLLRQPQWTALSTSF